MLSLVGPILITDNSVYTSSEYALLHMRKTTVSIQGLLSIDKNFVLNNYIVLLESCDVLFSQEIKIIQNMCGKNIIMIRHEPAYIKIMENTSITISGNEYCDSEIGIEFW